MATAAQDIVDVEKDAAFFAGDGADLTENGDYEAEDLQPDEESSSESVSRLHAIGHVTNVNITLKQQIRRRVRKWMRIVAAADPPASSTVSARVHPRKFEDRDIVSYAMRCLLALKG